jgi:hypothetical protein
MGRESSKKIRVSSRQSLSKDRSVPAAKLHELRNSWRTGSCSDFLGGYDDEGAVQYGRGGRDLKPKKGERANEQ